MHNLKDLILKDIQEERIVPRPRWHFVTLHILLWIFSLITLFAGIFAVSFVFFEFHIPGRAYVDWMSDGSVLLIRIMPFVWGVGAIAALGISWLLYAHTGRAYKYSAITLISILTLGSLLGGWLLYETKVPHFGEKQMQRFGPKYGDMRKNIFKDAPRPESGQLVIRIDSVDGNLWKGEDIEGNLWQVALICDEERCTDGISKIILPGPPILFLGEVTEVGKFRARDFRLPPRTKEERKQLKEEFGRSRKNPAEIQGIKN